MSVYYLLIPAQVTEPNGVLAAIQARARLTGSGFWATLAIAIQGLGGCARNMSDQKRIWRLVLPIAILALLLGTTVGMVWHQHVGVTSDNCPICHMSHQVIEPAVASIQVSTLVPAGTGPETQPIHLPPVSVPRDIPARGPPAHA